MAGDEPRLLARRSEHGYVHEQHLALHDEPEAIDAQTQATYAAAARRRDRERVAAAWAQAHSTIDAAMSTFKGVGQLDKGIVSAMRAIERTASGIDRRVGL